ncbi:MAG: putative lipoprotein [Bacteroidetes bacterium]|nr:putative lipoprotein [Bacteroidota bacterium]
MLTSQFLSIVLREKMAIHFITILVAALMMAGCQHPEPDAYTLQTPALTVTIDRDGGIRHIAYAGPEQVRHVRSFTRLSDCEPAGDVEIAHSDSQFSFRRKWISRSTGNSALVTDCFSKGNGSIRWEVEVAGLEGPWSTPVETHLVYPDSVSARFWTAWGDPRLGGIRSRSPEQQASLGILASDVTGNWSDPLLPIPFVDDTVWYGAPPFSYDNPRIGFIPFQGNLMGIPLVTVSEEQGDRGLSLILSPADTLLELNLRVSSSGEMVFSREHHRISSAAPVRLRMDLVAHESGWRGGLRWMAENYPGFFDPNIPEAHEIAGTGAYSSLEKPFDIQKMRRMAFGVNWKASFDFPYMGMFIPPVKDENQQWVRYGGGTTSIAAMRDYAAGMRSHGFHVLSYFNITEFGAEVTDPAPRRKADRDEDLWKNADDFLYYRLADAILRVSTAVAKDKLTFDPRARAGGPYYTWGNGIVMDPGEPVYQEFLLEQARIHITFIPDAEGICIDRMDWLRLYNEERDDNLSWFNNRPTRSLLVSWKNLLDQLGPMMHGSGKAIFVNNHDKRIDLLRQVDGFFDEFTYGGSPLNLTALMGVRRPVLGWTSEEKNLRPDPDAFFQRYLHLGVFPTAPFPGNDHSLQPSAWVDRQYLDYGPLLSLMKGKKWVLEPHCITVEGLKAKVNLFEVPGGWVVPVTFGPKEGTVPVTVRNVPGMTGDLKASAMYPGSDTMVPVAITGAGDALQMVVSTRRGCAMVKLMKETR